MKEYLENKRTLLQARLHEIQLYLEDTKKPIIKKDSNGDEVMIGFKYEDRKHTKSNQPVKNKLLQRAKIQRKIRRINKKLATIEQ